MAVLQHPNPPVFDPHAHIMVLGSFPSPKSREQRFYYMHPQNRFWRVLSDLWGVPLPETVSQKREFLLEHHIALWDVVARCEITGASDQSIRNVVPNDLGVILKQADIRAIFTTGAKAHTLYQQYCFPDTGRTAIRLPSTSPANCRMQYADLLQAYKILRETIEGDLL